MTAAEYREIVKALHAQDIIFLALFGAFSVFIGLTITLVLASMGGVVVAVMGAFLLTVSFLVGIASAVADHMAEWSEEAERESQRAKEDIL